MTLDLLILLCDQIFFSQLVSVKEINCQDDEVKIVPFFLLVAIQRQEIFHQSFLRAKFFFGQSTCVNILRLTQDFNFLKLVNFFNCFIQPIVLYHFSRKAILRFSIPLPQNKVCIVLLFKKLSPLAL